MKNILTSITATGLCLILSAILILVAATILSLPAGQNAIGIALAALFGLCGLGMAITMIVHSVATIRWERAEASRRKRLYGWQ